MNMIKNTKRTKILPMYEEEWINGKNVTFHNTMQFTLIFQYWFTNTVSEFKKRI